MNLAFKTNANNNNKIIDYNYYNSDTFKHFSEFYFLYNIKEYKVQNERCK